MAEKTKTSVDKVGERISQIGDSIELDESSGTEEELDEEALAKKRKAKKRAKKQKKRDAGESVSSDSSDSE